LLLFHANEPVASEQLIDELWGDAPPDTAAKIIQNNVSQLRKLGFKARRLEDGPPEWKAAGPVHRDHGFLNGACIWSRYGE